MNTYRFPRWEELPELNLYIDQVLTYLNDHFACICYSEDKIVTKSMINNYVKAGLVKPPIRKTYTRMHMAYFIVVLIMKKSFTLSEIDRLIQIQTSLEASSVAAAYNLFICRFEESLNCTFDEQAEAVPDMFITRKEQVLMDHVIQSIVHRLFAENVLLLTENSK